MKYPLFVSGPGRQAHGETHDARREHHTNNAPVIRRFPPAIQFLSRCEQFIESQIQTVAMQVFKQGKNVDQVCAEMYNTALSLGYIITIGVQEVYSSNMPSFPGETVMSCLIMVDFTPAGARASS